jgi:hypothetical protein
MMGLSSISTPLRPRVAIIAPTPRIREYGRRALRLLGCTPLIFLGLDEFFEIGDRANQMSLIFLEHSSSTAQGAESSVESGDRLRAAIGDEIPVVHSVPIRTGGAIPGFRGHDMLLPGSLSFAQLCRTLRGFLQKQGMVVSDASLEWGNYRFCLDSGLVFVAGRPVVLKADEFDLALELFFYMGSKVSRPWLKTMVPGLQALRRRATAPAADAALFRLRDLLGLQPEQGWDLQVNPGLSCTLVRSINVIHSQG